MPKIVISLPDSGEVTRELTEPQVSIGRTEDNTLQIDDVSISTHHAELIRRGGGYTVKDLGSTNGTHVNGEPLTGERTLRPGDQLQFGKIDAVYETDSPARVHSQPQGASEPSAVASAAASQRPENFGSVSPFQKRQVKGSPLDAVCIGTFAVAVVVFVASALVISAC
jgi:pSer/pThr/pTyr-binding forkhead associated (FHA) protein